MKPGTAAVIAIAAGVAGLVAAPTRPAAAARRCHVMAPWAANLASEVGSLKTQHAADLSRVCTAPPMSTMVPGHPLDLADVIAIHTSCQGSPSPDCLYVASQVANLADRVVVMGRYAAEHACPMPLLPHPC